MEFYQRLLLVIHKNIYYSGASYPTAITIYIKTDKLNEQLSKIIYFAIVKVSSPYLVMPKFIHSFHVYFTTDLRNNAFTLPIPTWWADQLISCICFIPLNGIYFRVQMKNKIQNTFKFNNNFRLPFDWKNLMGYTCAVAVQYMVGVCMFSIIANLLSLGFGAFLYAVRATTDITANLELINKTIKAKRHQKKSQNIRLVLFNFMRMWKS